MTSAAGGDAEPRPGGAGRRRRAARRAAVDILYQADVTGQKPADVLGLWRAAGRMLQPYTEELVRGVQDRLDEIDRMLGDHAEGWTVHRMAVLDRNILRLACYELLSGLPAPVAINEAVEVAGQLSTADSGRFVNGVLGRIAREVDRVSGEGKGEG